LKKKKKTPKKLLILLFFFILIIFAFQIAPNYKKQVKTDNINLVFNNKNITGKLVNKLLLQNDTIYVSMKDVQNIFDSSIILEENSNKIITVCNTKVAAIHINEQNIEINSVELQTGSSVIIQNEEYYLPISELEKVYNIETKYIEDSNICIIDEKDKELIGANLNKNTSLKSMKKDLSLTIQKLKKDEEIIIMNYENDGWIQIRTNNGKIGYIKENRIKEKYAIRENMEGDEQKIEENEITNISELKKIKIPKIEQMQTYDERANMIEKIVDESIKNTVKCLEINYDKLKQQDEEAYNRFLIELEANLKDVGIMLKK